MNPPVCGEDIESFCRNRLLHITYIIHHLRVLSVLSLILVLGAGRVATGVAAGVGRVAAGAGHVMACGQCKAGCGQRCTGLSHLLAPA